MAPLDCSSSWSSGIAEVGLPSTQHSYRTRRPYPELLAIPNIRDAGDARATVAALSAATLGQRTRKHDDAGSA
jgi:hypothetical protein